MTIYYYLKTGLLSLRQNYKSTLFVILSLAIGLATFISVMGYVSYEQDFDKTIPGSDNIYRITTDIYSSGELKISTPMCERAVGDELAKNFPEVENAGYLVKVDKPHFKINEEIFNDENVFYASPGLLDVFSIHLAQGNKKEVLARPYTIIISESTSKKYFGDKDPIGQTIFKYPGFEYEVEGVFRDLPPQLHFQADMLMSFNDQMHLPPPLKAQWGETSFYTYLKMGQGIDINTFEQKINQLVEGHLKAYFDNNQVLHQYHLQALGSIHLFSHFDHEIQANARGDYLYILLVVSLLIVLASAVNYFYFASTTSMGQAKDNGIRRAVGADKKHLVWLSASTSIWVHLFVLALATSICFLAQPLIQSRYGIHINLSWANIKLWWGVLLILSISFLLGGVLPAVILNKKPSYMLLKWKYYQGQKNNPFRQWLVMSQFVIVIGILISIVAINKQVDFLLAKDSGLNLENKLVVKTPSNMRRTSGRINNIEAFENELLNHSGIDRISVGSTIPGNTVASNFTFSEESTGKNGKAGLIVGDENFIQTYDINLLAGTNFYPNSNGCLINKKCLKDLGYTNVHDVIGKTINLSDESQWQKSSYKVLGLVDDFDFQSVKNETGSIIIVDWTENMVWGNYVVSLTQPDYASVLPFIKEKFEQTFVNYPFEYLVLEDFYKGELKAENNLQGMLKVFVLIGMALGMINLYAMAWHNSLMRVKEIGIRKVNGAKISEILVMLNSSFVKWVLLAFVVACPISWYAMHLWLENFAYKTTLSWWVFALAGFLALGIALLTVSWQSWRAATRNPVEALRYE